MSASHLATQTGASVVWLRVAFSERHGADPQLRIGAGLNQLLARSGIAAQAMSLRIVLLGYERAVTPRDWSRVIGWLLCKPEVVFVYREFPVTRRHHVPAR
ncbi:MAG: hypothetical protein HZC37_13585 [Burkholderiales bacterium]|nr:hypothetical protein [Burkholderiales bacterium]